MRLVNFFMSKYIKSLLIVFLFVIVNWSCTPSGNENIPKSEYTDSNINTINHSYSQPLKVSKPLLTDTVYNSLPHATIRELCNKYQLKSTYFFRNKDYSKATLYADSMLMIIQNNGLQNKLAVFYGKAHLIKGDVFMILNDNQNAFQYYYEGKRNIEVTHDTCAYAEYAKKLAGVCYKQANYLDAAHYFREGFNDQSHCSSNVLNKFVFQQGSLDNIALSYDKLGFTDSAIYYYKQALSYIDQHEHELPPGNKIVEISRGVIFGNLATSYYKSGKLEDAETLFKKSILINTKKGYDNADAQLTQLKLADLYLKTKRLNEAKQVLEEIKTSLDTLPGNNTQKRRQGIEARLYKLQSDYYSHMHNPEVANNYLNAYIALKDSIDESNKKLLGIDFNKEFENIENKYAYAVLKRNDQEKTLSLYISLIIGAMGITITVLIWQSRKRLRKLNEQITTQNAEMQTTLSALEQSQEENTRMMKIVSHDLRSPINGIMGITSVLLKEEHTDEQAQMLGMIRTSGANAIEFINDLLHVNSALTEMKKEPVDMVPLLQHCVDLLQFKANEKEQHIILKTEPATLVINRQKIWRVISNLVTNAIKFSPGGTTIQVTMELKPHALLISVKDHGIGIPVNLKSEIFNMFTTAMRPGTDGEQSFGLGLAISKQIIDAHNGKIWFENETGNGTIFFIELPVSSQ